MKSADRSSWTFGEVLSWHLFENGSRPDGHPNSPGKIWGKKEFAAAAGKEDARSVRYWLANKHLPVELIGIENALFGENQAYAAWRHELRRAFGAAKKGSATAGAVAVWTGCPYPGLRSFRTEEFAIFVGRDREISELVDRLRIPSLGFLSIVGGSGAGKSSLVRAGLLPALEKDGNGGDHRVVLAFTPTLVTKNPFVELASKLAPELSRDGARKPVDLAKPALLREPGRISSYLD